MAYDLMGFTLQTAFCAQYLQLHLHSKYCDNICATFSSVKTQVKLKLQYLSDGC